MTCFLSDTAGHHAGFAPGGAGNWRQQREKRQDNRNRDKANCDLSTNRGDIFIAAYEHQPLRSKRKVDLKSGKSDLSATIKQQCEVAAMYDSW
jgi:hypothetical protein